MKITQNETLAAVLIAAVSAFALGVAISESPSEAYLFPLILAASVCVFALIMAGQAWAEARGKKDGNAGAADDSRASSAPPARLLASLAVFVPYLLLLETLGFYLSSWLACVAIVLLYGPRLPNTGREAGRRDWPGLARPIGRAMLAAAGFTLALYGLFHLGLRVQTPCGLFC